MVYKEDAWQQVMIRVRWDYSLPWCWFRRMSKSWKPRGKIGSQSAGRHSREVTSDFLVVDACHKLMIGGGVEERRL